MKKLICSFGLILALLPAHGQELFPTTEPASNVPKGALGIRLWAEGYREADLFRTVSALRIMYGVTPKLSVYLTGTLSDYHEKTLPFDFISHNHSGSTVSGGANTPQAGIPYPDILNSVDAYLKYRFITADGENEHLRVSAYAEASYVGVPSHEAEPDLLVHTSGYGGGLIGTWLVHHFAASLTAGCIIPSTYKGNATDKFGGIYPTTIQYGQALVYNLSAGYLLFPKSYSGYTQTNWNVYCELLGKSYGAAHVTQLDGPPSPILPDPLLIKVSNNTPILRAGNFVDINPGIQCIIRSVYRFEASVEFPLINRSYDHLYPLYLLAVQRYFFTGTKHKAEKND